MIYKKQILLVTDAYTVSYHKGKVFVAKNGSNEIKSVKLFKSIKYYVLSKIRIFERLFRLEPRFAIDLNDKMTLLSSRGRLLVLDNETGNFYTEHVYNKGTLNPLSIISFERNGERLFAYGDYGGHNAEGNVSVMVRKHNEWSELFSFPKGSILHVHNLIYDKHRDCLWILTGDSDSESGFWKYDMCRSVLAPYITGKQIYRSCCGFLNKESIIYATDSPLIRNGLFCLNTKTKTISKLADTPGPCIYGRQLNINGSHFFLFSTSVEPDSSLPKRKYMFSYKLGKGVVDRNTHLFLWSEKLGCVEIARFRKDILPMWLFKFGNIRFTYHESIGEKILIIPEAVKKYDGKTIEIDIKPFLSPNYNRNTDI